MKNNILKSFLLIMLKSFLLIMAFALASCGDGLTEKVISTHKNGQPAKILFFDKENKCVREVDYHDNGFVYMEGAIKNDLRDGEWISYFKDGKVQSKGFYKDGLRTGKALVYHENGNLWMDGYYCNDHKCGEWIHYDEQGYEVSRSNFGDCD